MKVPTPAFDALSLGLLVATLVLLATGQVAFKLAAQGLAFSQPRTFLTPAMLAALVLYALATLSWLAVLSRLPLSVAFPFYGLAFLLVPLFAHWLLREPVGPSTWIGGALILAGIAVTATGARG